MNLAEIRERVSKATEGPWEWEAADDTMIALGNPEKGGPFFGGHVLTAAEVCKACRERGARCLLPKEADADFIAHARQDVPDLLDALEEALGLLEKVRKERCCSRGVEAFLAKMGRGEE